MSYYDGKLHTPDESKSDSEEVHSLKSEILKLRTTKSNIISLIFSFEKLITDLCDDKFEKVVKRNFTRVRSKRLFKIIKTKSYGTPENNLETLQKSKLKLQFYDLKIEISELRSILTSFKRTIEDELDDRGDDRDYDNIISEKFIEKDQKTLEELDLGP